MMWRDQKTIWIASKSLLPTVKRKTWLWSDIFTERLCFQILVCQFIIVLESRHTMTTEAFSFNFSLIQTDASELFVVVWDPELAYLLVEVLDGPPDLSVLLVEVRVLEALAPVAKVRRDDEESARPQKVLGQQLAVHALLLAINAAHHDGHNVKVAALAKRTNKRTNDKQLIKTKQA